MTFFVHRSNRTERLVDALAGVVAEPQANVLAPEWIVVSSPGMERWLSMQLAKRVGVWANPAFPFPRKLIDTIMQHTLGDVAAASSGYEPTCMLFSIAALLSAARGDERFAEVQRYLGDDERPGRRLALATRLAELFDQYLTYRPERVQQWAAGAEQDFQAPLLRALIEKHGSQHLAARAARTVATAMNSSAIALITSMAYSLAISSHSCIGVPSHAAVGPGARRTQRKPTWLVDVSTGWA